MKEQAPKISKQQSGSDSGPSWTHKPDHSQSDFSYYQGHNRNPDNDIEKILHLYPQGLPRWHPQYINLKAAGLLPKVKSEEERQKDLQWMKEDAAKNLRENWGIFWDGESFHKMEDRTSAQPGETIQAKPRDGGISVSRPDDKEEIEADRMADRVMREEIPQEEEEKLHKKPSPNPLMAKSADSGVVDKKTETEVKSLRGKGSPLPKQTREFMESRFGADFSGVRVHTNHEAMGLSQRLNAKAFTFGKDIAFNRGEFSPETRDGKKLIAHELTHTVQQGAVGRMVQRQEDGEQEDNGEQSTAGFMFNWLLGVVQGEWNENPTTAQIIVDTSLTLIPYVDQAGDARDIAAYIYKLAYEKKYDDVFIWIGFIFTLIGLFPELGSAIKGFSRVILKSIREGSDEAFILLSKLSRKELLALDRAIKELPLKKVEFKEKILSLFNQFETKTGDFRGILHQVDGLIDKSPEFLNIKATAKKSVENLDKFLEDLQAVIPVLKEAAPAKIDEAIDLIGENWAGLAQRLGLKVIQGGAQEAESTNRGADTWAKMSGMLRDAARGKGNFGIGEATSEQAIQMGKAWVGEGYRIASDGKTLVSADNLRVFRPPSYKPRLKKWQANFERRFEGQLTKPTQSNAHLDILR